MERIYDMAIAAIFAIQNANNDLEAKDLFDALKPDVQAHIRKGVKMVETEKSLSITDLTGWKPAYVISPEKNILEGDGPDDETQFVECDDADADHFALYRRNDEGGPESDPFVHIEDFHTRAGAEDYVRTFGGEVLKP